MPARIEADRAQLDQAKDKLKGAREALQNDHVVMKHVAVFLDRWVQKNFQTQGGNVDGWDPFKYGGRITTKKKGKAQSAEARSYIDPSAKLLQNTGHLRLSFLPFYSRGNAGIGSDLPYSEAHEKGAGPLPQRRMLPKREEVFADVNEIIEGWVVASLKRWLPE